VERSRPEVAVTAIIGAAVMVNTEVAATVIIEVVVVERSRPEVAVTEIIGAVVMVNTEVAATVIIEVVAEV
jgi:hypothetical protein